MFDLTKEILSNLKNAIFPEQQLAPLGPNIQLACAACTGSCKNACKGSCKGSCKGGCTRSCKGSSR